MYPVIGYLADWTSGNYLPTNYCSLTSCWILLSQKRKSFPWAVSDQNIWFVWGFPKSKPDPVIIVEEHAAGGCVTEIIEICTALDEVWVYIYIHMHTYTYSKWPWNAMKMPWKVSVSPVWAKHNDKKAVFRSGREPVWWGIDPPKCWNTCLRGSCSHVSFLLEGTSGSHLVWSLPQSRANLKSRSGCSAPCPVQFWESPRMA